MSNQLILIIIIGSAISGVLGWYALHLWRKLWKHQEALAAHEQQNRDKIAGDLKILLGSLLDEQAPWVELCIRIKVILEHYDFELSQHDDYQVFQLVYQVCENIPTHQAWKDLPKAERRAYEAGFTTLEEQHKASSFKAAKQLKKLLG